MKTIHMLCAAAICYYANGANSDNARHVSYVEYKQTDITRSAIVRFQRGGVLVYNTDDATRSPYGMAFSILVHSILPNKSVMFGQVGREAVEEHVGRHVAVDEKARDWKKTATNPEANYRLLMEACGKRTYTSFEKAKVNVMLAILEAISKGDGSASMALYDLTRAMLFADSFLWKIEEDKVRRDVENLIMVFVFDNKSLTNVRVVLKNKAEDKDTFTFITCYPVENDLNASYDGFSCGDLRAINYAPHMWLCLARDVDKEKLRSLSVDCLKSAAADISSESIRNDQLPNLLLFLGTLWQVCDIQYASPYGDFYSVHVALQCLFSMFGCGLTDRVACVARDLLKLADHKERIIEASQILFSEFASSDLQAIDDLDLYRDNLVKVINIKRGKGQQCASGLFSYYDERIEDFLSEKKFDAQVKKVCKMLCNLRVKSLLLLEQEAAGAVNVEQLKCEFVKNFNAAIEGKDEQEDYRRVLKFMWNLGVRKCMEVSFGWSHNTEKSVPYAKTMDEIKAEKGAKKNTKKKAKKKTKNTKK